MGRRPTVSDRKKIPYGWYLSSEVDHRLKTYLFANQRPITNKITFRYCPNEFQGPAGTLPSQFSAVRKPVRHGQSAPISFRFRGSVTLASHARENGTRQLAAIGAHQSSDRWASMGEPACRASRIVQANDSVPATFSNVLNWNCCTDPDGVVCSCRRVAASLNPLPRTSCRPCAS